MSDIKFKSVGKTSQTQLRTALTGSVVPIGIVTPMRHGNNSEGIYAMHTSLRAQIADNLKNLLSTNRGERLIFSDLGANLYPLVFETVNSHFDFDEEAINRIKTVVKKYMPFIDLATFNSTIDNHDNLHTGKVNINVTYNIPMLSVSEEEITITLYIV
tara:strand:- start:338 stop:811 length:474 start_codon:yes stop_codon:yes gene_type:complete